MIVKIRRFYCNEPVLFSLVYFFFIHLFLFVIIIIIFFFGGGRVLPLDITTWNQNGRIANSVLIQINPLYLLLLSRCLEVFSSPEALRFKASRCSQILGYPTLTVCLRKSLLVRSTLDFKARNFTAHMFKPIHMCTFDFMA